MRVFKLLSPYMPNRVVLSEICRKMSNFSVPHLPYCASGRIVKGFGRGSKQLGIPTANYSEDVVDKLPPDFPCGVYFGWAQVENGPVEKMVMSVGWNPFYKNEKKSMETHILAMNGDLYGLILKIVIMGYIRPEKSFSSLSELLSAINEDIEYAKNALDNPQHSITKCQSFFNQPTNNVGHNNKL
ncbi:hypothetical protein CHUAL_000956 [Chamberlinius hualienensis]